MIHIIVNNKKIMISSEITLAEFLKQHHWNQPHIAIAINKKVIPRSDYHNVALAMGDEIDIVSPLQGG